MGRKWNGHNMEWAEYEMGRKLNVRKLEWAKNVQKMECAEKWNVQITECSKHRM